jgi:hypothetical protein
LAVTRDSLCRRPFAEPTFADVEEAMAWCKDVMARSLVPASLSEEFDKARDAFAEDDLLTAYRHLMMILGCRSNLADKATPGAA